jgi:hypothetical protein
MSDEMAAGPWNNGLLASSYVALTDVPAAVAPQLLSALSRARIAAYLAEAPGSAGALRLFVASSERADARTIVAAVLRSSGRELPAEPRPDPLAGIDADAEFEALIADWHVDTHAAIRDAERSLSREDAEWRQQLDQPETPGDDELTWLDEGHYVPPAPPPIPRPTVPIVMGMLLVIVSVMLFLGVSGIIGAGVLFVTRLRKYRDEDDDGAVL